MLVEVPTSAPRSSVALADVGVIPDDAAVDLRAVVNDSVVANRARTVDDDAALDLAVVAQEDRAEELRIRRDLDAILGPDAAAEIGAGQLDIDLPLQHIGVGAHVFGEVADIAPVAFGGEAVDRITLLQHHGEELLAEVEGLVALEVAEDTRDRARRCRY